MKQLILMMAMMASASVSMADEPMQHMHHGDAGDDKRISLGLPPAMKQHQLANMRSHVDAIRQIVGLLADRDFDQAADVAHSKLGLTEEMKQMCTMFRNEDFNKLGMEFHQSGDALGEALKTRDVNLSLKALNKTMGYCVQCHATFRQ